MNEELVKAIVTELTKQGRLKEAKLFEIKDAAEVEDLVKGLTPEQKTFTELLSTEKDYQSEFDKLITKAVNTREEKLKAEYNFIKKEGDPDPTPDTRTAREKKLESDLEELRKLVVKSNSDTAVQKLRSEAMSKLKEAKIPERYIQFFDLEDKEKSIDDQFTDIKTEFDSFKESLKKDLNVNTTGLPFPTHLGDGQASEAEIKEITKNL